MNASSYPFCFEGKNYLLNLAATPAHHDFVYSFFFFFLLFLRITVYQKTLLYGKLLGTPRVP